VRVANLLVIDEILTAESALVYTSDALCAKLGAFDQIALMAVVDDVTQGVNVGPGFKVSIRHSADGRNWLPKNSAGVAEIGGASGIRLPTGQTAYAGGDGGDPSLAFVQIAASLGASNLAAHVRVYVTARDVGSA
jgi:hypothetical protein